MNIADAYEKIGECYEQIDKENDVMLENFKMADKEKREEMMYEALLNLRTR